MERKPEEIMKLFMDNGRYSYTDTTKITEYKISKRFDDFSDLMSNCTFDANDPNKNVPKFLLQDVPYIDAIARLGVAGLADIREYAKIRMSENKDTMVREFRDEHYSDIKNMLEEYVRKSILAKVRIESKEDGETKVMYAYSITSTGAKYLNNRFGRIFKDSDEYRTLSDVNTRDIMGRMAVARVALFIKRQNLEYEILQNKFSKIAKDVRVGRERFPCVMYSPKLHSEILIQHLYFKNNPQLENEVDRWEYIRDIVRKVFEWVRCAGEIGKNKEMSSRNVILVCNEYNDFSEFMQCLCNDYATTNYFDFIGNVYATSVGMLEDDVLGANEKFYHRRTAEEENGVMKLYDDEFNFIFPVNEEGVE